MTTKNNFKVANGAKSWKYFPTLEDAIKYEKKRRAKDGVFRAIEAVRQPKRKGKP